MKKWRYALMSLLLTIGILGISKTNANAEEILFNVGGHYFASGDTVVVMQGEDFPCSYSLNRLDHAQIYRMENDEVIIQTEYYHSREDSTHPSDYKLYAALPENGFDPKPETDPYINIHFESDPTKLPDDYYYITANGKNITPGLGYGDDITFKINNYFYTQPVNDFSIVDYPTELLKHKDGHTYEAIGTGEGNVVVEVAGKRFSMDIMIGAVKYKYNIVFNYVQDNGPSNTYTVFYDEEQSASNTFMIGRTYGLTLSEIISAEGYPGVDHMIKDPENVQWSVDNDNVTIDHEAKTITFNQEGMTYLTASYNGFELKTKLFIRNAGIQLEIMDDHTEAIVNQPTQFMHKVTVFEDLETTYDNDRTNYLLSDDMQAKYGVKYLTNIDGVQYVDGAYTFDEKLKGQTISYQIITIDICNSHHQEICVPKMATIEAEAIELLQKGEIDSNEFQNRMSLATEYCDCFEQEAYRVEMEIIANGEKQTGKSYPASVTVLDNSVENQQKKLDEIYQNLDNPAYMENQKSVLSHLYQQILPGKDGSAPVLELTYDDILKLDECLQAAYNDNITINHNGITKVEGLITGVPLEKVNMLTKLSLTAEPQTEDHAEYQIITDHASKQDQKILAAYEIALTCKIDIDDAQTITQTAHPVRITMPMPEGVTNPENLVVLRNHEGTITELPVTIVDGQIVFETDRFSTYALVEKNATTNPDETQSPNEQDKNDPETEITDTEPEIDGVTPDNTTEEASLENTVAPKTADTFNASPYLLVGLVALSLAAILGIRQSQRH